MTASKAERSKPLAIGDHVVPPGASERFDLPVAQLPTHTQINLPLTVINARKSGPVVWLSAAVHGDELNGVEIIARVLERIETKISAGALLAAPVVNVFGFINGSRYLPDRRDLNRSFPGSERGPLASRIAHVFLQEIVGHCTHGIDLHTAAQDRSNYPQIRTDLSIDEAKAMAEAFQAPVTLHAPTRDGSLRGSATKRGKPVIVYEGGEAQRFNEEAIDVGVRGVLRVLDSLGMIHRKTKQRRPTITVQKSSWLRARSGGVLRLAVGEGQTVEARQIIGHVADVFGADAVPIRAPHRGIIIGMSLDPVVNDGDAVVHLGRLD